MKKTLKIIAVVVSVMVAAAAIILFAATNLIVNMLKGDEVFETTTEEIQAFDREHLSGDTALDAYFTKLTDQTGVEFTIAERHVDTQLSFANSTYTKDEGSFDNHRQVYVDIAYRTAVPDSSPYSVCETCRYHATATYQYEDGEYKMDAVKFEQDWLFEALEQTLAPEYIETDTLPDSPYYYHIVSNHEYTISFNELSATGYWDKDTENFMLTTPIHSDPVQLLEGVIAGHLFDYATGDTTTGFLRINKDGSLSLYRLPMDNPHGTVEDADIPEAELMKTFIPKIQTEE